MTTRIGIRRGYKGHGGRHSCFARSAMFYLLRVLRGPPFVLRVKNLAHAPPLPSFTRSRCDRRRPPISRVRAKRDLARISTRRKQGEPRSSIDLHCARSAISCLLRGPPWPSLCLRVESLAAPAANTSVARKPPDQGSSANAIALASRPLRLASPRPQVLWGQPHHQSTPNDA